MNSQILAAGLAAVLALCALAELLTVPRDVPAVLPTALPRLPPAAAPDESSLGQWAALVLARPLFRADRRPLAVAAAAVADDTLPRLSAIIVTAAGRSALFAGDADTPMVVIVGGRIGAYQVRTITPDSVSLLGPHGAVKVHPQYAPGGAAPGRAAPPPASALPNRPL